MGTGTYRPVGLGGKFKEAAVGTSPAYGPSAQVVEVSVDMDTGKVLNANLAEYKIPTALGPCLIGYCQKKPPYYIFCQEIFCP